jgi:hypothetical protein
VTFSIPQPENQIVVLVDASRLRRAERLIQSCEHCHREDAEIPFDHILDRITGSDPRFADYFFGNAGRCPNCRREIFEKTLVEPR